MKLIGVSEGVASFSSRGEYVAEISLVQAPEHLLQQVDEVTSKQQAEAPRGETKEEPSPIQRWWWRLMNVRLFAGSVHLQQLIRCCFHLSAVIAVSIGLHQNCSLKHQAFQFLFQLSLMPAPNYNICLRLTKILCYFPASSKGPPLHPEHLELLKQEIDIRMCMAQEAALTSNINERRLSNSLASTSDASHLTQVSEGSPLNPVVHSGKNEALDIKLTPVEAEHSAKKQANSSNSQASLVLVHEMLHEISTRLLLSAIRKELRRLVGERSVWEGKLKLAVATRLKPGYRLYYWMETPLVTDAMLQGKAVKSPMPSSWQASINIYFNTNDQADGLLALQLFALLICEFCSPVVLYWIVDAYPFPTHVC